MKLFAKLALLALSLFVVSCQSPMETVAPKAVVETEKESRNIPACGKYGCYPAAVLVVREGSGYASETVLASTLSDFFIHTAEGFYIPEGFQPRVFSIGGLNGNDVEIKWYNDSIGDYEVETFENAWFAEVRADGVSTYYISITSGSRDEEIELNVASQWW